MTQWEKVKPGSYRTVGSDGLVYRAERHSRGGWWVLWCGPAARRYATLREIKEVVK